MSWVVGKTLVATGGIHDRATLATERRAQAEMSRLMRQHKRIYGGIPAAVGLGWGPMLARLEKMADTLELGRWPASQDGLNWIWSLNWDNDPHGDRDVWVFWVRQESSGGGSGGENPEDSDQGPTGGIRQAFLNPLSRVLSGAAA